MTVFFELIGAEPDLVSGGTRLVKYPTLCQHNYALPSLGLPLPLPLPPRPFLDGGTGADMGLSS